MDRRMGRVCSGPPPHSINRMVVFTTQSPDWVTSEQKVSNYAVGKRREIAGARNATETTRVDTETKVFRRSRERSDERFTDLNDPRVDETLNGKEVKVAYRKRRVVPVPAYAERHGCPRLSASHRINPPYRERLRDKGSGNFLPPKRPF